MRRGYSHLAVLLALSTTVSATGVAFGSVAQAAPSRSEEVASTVGRASDVVDIDANPTAPFPATAGAGTKKVIGQGVSVSTEAQIATVELTNGQAPLTVSLPSAQGSTDVRVTANGTAVLPDPDGDLDLAVQSFDTGAVRINAVLHTSDAPTVTDYQLKLPAGARLQPLPEQGGYVVVVKDDVLPPSVPGTADDFDYDQGSGSVPITPKPKPPVDDTHPIPAAQNEAPEAAAPADQDDTSPPTDGGSEADDAPPYDEGEAEELAALVGLADDEVPAFRIDSPWAVDANGTRLPTTYTLDGSTLKQTVDTRSAAFPVVADPAFIPVVVYLLTAAAARAAAPAVARAVAAQAIRATAKATVQGGYRTFNAFKKANVTGREKTHDWHHIVEQSNIKRHGWDARTIHNKNNMLQIPRRIHQQCVNANMARKNVSLPGWTSGPYNTLRDSIKGLSFERQYQIGVLLLKYCGVKL